VSVVVWVALLAELGSLSLPAYSQERVVAAYGGISGQQAPLWVASDLGIFKKYRLHVEAILIRGGAIRTAAISAGEVQFGVDAAVSPVTSAVSGADVVIVTTFYNKHPWSFAVRPEIKTPEDLKGKKIGVASLGASNHMAVASALRYWGIDERSVTILRAGGTAERLAALQTGMIDATVLIAPETGRARKAGIPILLELGELREGFPTISVVATKRFSHQQEGCRQAVP
jgi:ABC-type nitrate/sulfonate/bicarbonate transport system substrate-binding protein